jgi:hypothetical protein
MASAITSTDETTFVKKSFGKGHHGYK